MIDEGILINLVEAESNINSANACLDKGNLRNGLQAVKNSINVLRCVEMQVKKLIVEGKKNG